MQLIPWHRSHRCLVWMSAGAVIVADFMFYGHSVGWSIGLYLLPLEAVLLLRYRRILKHPAEWALV